MRCIGGCRNGSNSRNCYCGRAVPPCPTFDKIHCLPAAAEPGFAPHRLTESFVVVDAAQPGRLAGEMCATSARGLDCSPPLEPAIDLTSARVETLRRASVLEIARGCEMRHGFSLAMGVPCQAVELRFKQVSTAVPVPSILGVENYPSHVQDFRVQSACPFKRSLPSKTLEYSVALKNMRPRWIQPIFERYDGYENLGSVED